MHNVRQLTEAHGGADGGGKDGSAGGGRDGEGVDGR